MISGRIHARSIKQEGIHFMRHILASIALTAVASTASAQFTIINSNFELPDYAPNQHGTSGTPGWEAIAGSGQWGSFYPTMATWGYVAPEGTQLLYTNNRTVQQTLVDVVEEGLTYTLEVDVINRPTYGSMNYIVELVFGDTVVAFDHASLVPPVGGALTSTLTYTALAGDPLIGESITIRLGGPGTQCNFDNVRLNGVPTPASLALVGLGGLVAARRRR